MQIITTIQGLSMRFVIRYFFRTIRLILTPVMLVSERLSTPRPVSRSPDQQDEVDQAAKQLALYQFQACPFCIRVRKELARLNVPVEKRDAQHDSEHRAALEAGGGRVKVPCLLIRHTDGSNEWLYESEAITAWLQERFEPGKTA